LTVVIIKDNKLELISNLFEGKEIRSVWNNEKEDYYFSVVDVIYVLANPKDPSDYWTTLKRRMVREEKSELPTNCRRLKLKAKDGKMCETDVLDTEGILRLIESVPSPKAEPFKLWLASLGKRKIDSIYDPSIGSVANNTKKDLEEKLGYKVINNSNNLNIKYIDIEDK